MASLRAWKTLTIQPYDRRLFVYRDRQAITAALKRYGYDPGDHNDTCLGICWKVERDGVGCYLLGWFDGRRSTLVHELGHLAIQVLTSAGMNVCDSNGEAMCYLMDHIAQELGIDN